MTGQQQHTGQRAAQKQPAQQGQQVDDFPDAPSAAAGRFGWAPFPLMYFSHGCPPVFFLYCSYYTKFPGNWKGLSGETKGKANCTQLLQKIH